MKTAFLTLGLLLSAAPAAVCQAPANGAPADAATLYRAGQFEQAAQAYEQLASSAPDNAYYAYNLGNAYFKLDRLGKAVARYRRAFELQPRDPDIRANLSFAVKKSGDELVPAGMPEVLHSIYHLLSLKELGGLFWLFCWAALLPGAVCVWPSRRKSWLLAVAIGFSALSAASGAWLLARRATGLKNPAVVVDTQAELRAGPGENFSTAATIPEGHTVEVLESNQDWRLVGVPSKNIKGWVKATALEKP